MYQGETRQGRDCTLTLKLEGNRWVMEGGKYGSHSVPNEGDDAVAAHWDGYCQNNGWVAPRTVKDGDTIFNAMTGSSASWKAHFAGRY